MYNILITYDTGDSFHQEYDVTSEIPLKTNNLELAKENLNRIEEHYEYYTALDKKNDILYRGNYLEKQEKQKIDETIKSARTKDWFVERFDHCLKLKLDGGKEFQMSAFWCGFFETLKSAEIISDDPDVKIVFNE